MSHECSLDQAQFLLEIYKFHNPFIHFQVPSERENIELNILLLHATSKFRFDTSDSSVTNLKMFSLISNYIQSGRLTPQSASWAVGQSIYHVPSGRGNKIKVLCLASLENMYRSVSQFFLRICKDGATAT